MTDCQHPLLIDLVAKEILKYSKLEDLAAHRLVCKTWFEASLSQWRSTATLTILQRKLTGNGVAVASGSGSNQPSTTTTTAEMPGSHSSALWVNDNNDAGGCGGVTLSKLKLIVAKKTKDISSSFLQLDSKPFAKYKLKRWTIRDAPTFKLFDNYDDDDYRRKKFQEYNKKELICGAENFPQFWQKFGPLMQSLTIDEFEFLPVHNIPLLAIIFQHTPNLEELKLSRNNFPVVAGLVRFVPILHQDLPLKIKLKTLVVDGQLPVRLSEIIKVFSNLESFSLHRCTPRMYMEDLGNLMKSELPMKNLSIMFYTDPLPYGGLAEIRETREENSGELKRLLPLKTLELGTMTVDFDGSDFLEIVSFTLDDYAEFGGLEVVKLYMTPFCEQPSELKMARMMESTKHFEIWGNWLQSLGFLRWMPNLKNLEVHISCFEKWDQIRKIGSYGADEQDCKTRFVTNFNQDIVQNALFFEEMKVYVGEQLKSLYIDYEFGQGSLKTLSKWMPQLKELKTILNNATLQTVCGLWGDLEELNLLYGSSADDQGITGVGKKKAGKNRRQPINLTSLQNLKSFRLETYCCDSKLGDLSATEGFLKMGTLKTLEICVSPQMSLEIETQLKDAIVNAKIIRNYGENEPAHLNYGKCCKRLQFLYASVEGASPNSQIQQSTFKN